MNAQARYTHEQTAPPRCPTCGSVSRYCFERGLPTLVWHRDREDLLADACRCGICLLWLHERGKQ